MQEALTKGPYVVGGAARRRRRLVVREDGDDSPDKVGKEQSYDAACAAYRKTHLYSYSTSLE